MAGSKSSTLTNLAPFRRQAYQSWYLDGYNLAEFTKVMDVLFVESKKITFWSISASERQWRTCKTVWDKLWNIKDGGISQEARLELEALHVWFCKAPGGAIIWNPLGLDPLTLATLLPGLAEASETRHLAGQPLRLSDFWDGAGEDEACRRGHKSQPSYSNSAASETEQHYFKASPSDTHVPNANSVAVASYYRPGGTNVSVDKALGNYTPYSQLNDSSCVQAGQAVSETASSIQHVAPYCAMSRFQGALCAPGGPARPYAEWPDAVTQGCQCIPASNISGFNLPQIDTSRMDWLAAIDL